MLLGATHHSDKINILADSAKNGLCPITGSNLCVLLRTGECIWMAGRLETLNSIENLIFDMPNHS